MLQFLERLEGSLIPDSDVVLTPPVANLEVVVLDVELFDWKGTLEIVELMMNEVSETNNSP